MEFKEPYNDNYLIYNKGLKKYILTEIGVRDLTGIDLDFHFRPTILGSSNSSQKNAFLIKVSTLVYNYIYSSTPHKKQIEYILATYRPLRREIQDMLTNQVDYLLNGGGNVSNQSGLNLLTGQVTFNKVLFEKMVSPYVSMLIRQKITDLGFSLIYNGCRFPLHIDYNIEV